jgi:outer membrane protein OmpA-like peptidoglycan-associated protein
VDKSSVLETLEEAPPRREPWALWIVLALILSVGAHLAFAWWARTYAVKTFSDSYYEEMVPRAFKVDRVEIDSRLLDDENPASADETQRKITPAPVDLPAEDISTEKAEVRAAPAKPGQLGIDKEPAPEIGLAASDAAARLEAATAAALEEDLASIREALLADTPSSAAQPAIELAAAAGRAGAEGTDSVPAGYSDLDDLLAQTGGLTAAGPIFMPSDVLFGYDESFLRPEAITSLEKLGELIRRNPDARFRIEGHTDAFGGADYNAQLSLARADSVKRWLAETMSIGPARIDTRGLGSTRPLAPVTGTVEEQQLNRRVEIVILRADSGR